LQAANQRLHSVAVVNQDVLNSSGSQGRIRRLKLGKLGENLLDGSGTGSHGRLANHHFDRDASVDPAFSGTREQHQG
jgi:hypothetical protein